MNKKFISLLAFVPALFACGGGGVNGNYIVQNASEIGHEVKIGTIEEYTEDSESHPTIFPSVDTIKNNIVEVFTNYDIKTEIIAASIRHPMHVVECAKAGADIATIPYKVIMQMIKHPLTTEGIEKFVNDYKKVFG